MQISKYNYSIQGNIIHTKQRSTKKSVEDIEVTALAKEFFGELERCGYIKKLKETPHFGSHRVQGAKRRSRYDYVCQQIYLHSIARNAMKADIMMYSYGHELKCLKAGEKKVSLWDAELVFVMSYNIGHFYNTFSASCAAIRICKENLKMRDKLLSSIIDERFSNAAKRILSNEDAMHIHLINSLVLLEKCNQELESVRVAKELIYNYLSLSSELEKDLEWVFFVFHQIRDIAYLMNDLLFAPVPLSLDSEKGIPILIKELLSKYNNKAAPRRMIESIRKLLDDAFYYEPEEAFRQEQVVRSICRMIRQEMDLKEWSYYVADMNSPFNIRQKTKSMTDSNVLKLTFTNQNDCRDIRDQVVRMNGVYCTTYSRTTKEETLLVANRKSNNDRTYTSFRILKNIVSIEKDQYDCGEEINHLLLCVKFFLSALFGNRYVEIIADIIEKTGLYIARGKKSRAKYLESKIQSYSNNPDTKHEAEFVLSRLMEDKKNDTAIVIPSSIIVYKDNEPSTPYVEFDGMIVFPNRVENQLIFCEAKNRDQKPGTAKKDLKRKFAKLNVMCRENDIITVGMDAYYTYTVE